MIDDHTRRPTESEGSRPDGPYAGLLDESRLEPDERELWHELSSQDPEEAPAMKLWSFGHVCMLELRGIPDVVAERFAELDPDGQILRYYENVRRAREEGRR
jgi:hypothetical protein